MELEEKIARGHRAKEILQDEVYIETFEIVKMELNLAWESSPARDTEGREKLYLMMKLLTKLQLALQTTMETGMLSQETLKHQKSLIQRAKEAAGLL
jgi:hypothetical protein